MVVKTLAVAAFILTLSVAPALAAQSPADVAGAPAPGAPAPIADVFEDGAQRLRLVGLPSQDGTALDVTLVYEDADQKVARSISVDAARLASKSAPELKEFLAGMDSDFVSYVRATIADRILHLHAEATPFERAEAALFFANAPRAGSVARRASQESAGLE